jgi:hypothetical protein
LITELDFGARVVYMPAGGRCGRATLLTGQMLHLYLSQDLPNTNHTRNTIILIRRSKRRRWFNNHDAIAEMMSAEAKANNLDFYVFRDDPVPDFETTRRVFNSAIIIVAPHGAGESNMVFTQPGTVLIEGVCVKNTMKLYLYQCFQIAAYYHGIRYHGVFNEKSCFDITPDEIKRPLKFYLQHLGELYDS